MSCVSDYLCGYLLIMLFTIDSWPPTCKGKRQSPIEIYDSSVQRFSEPSWKLKLVNYDKTISSEAWNDGHTVILSIDKDDDIYAVGGGLAGKYYLKQIHFHWKSEHKLNRNRLPLEAHFVHSIKKDDHHRVKRSNISSDDDIHVIGVLYKLAIDENKEISDVIKAIKETPAVGSKAKITFTPRVLLPWDMTEFYRYEGSLTTPPCYEIVHWTIFPNMVNLSLDQYDVIRETEGFGGKYTHNYRHIMPLNDRVVKLYRTSYNNGALYPVTQSAKWIYTLIFVIFFMF